MVKMEGAGVRIGAKLFGRIRFEQDPHVTDHNPTKFGTVAYITMVGRSPCYSWGFCFFSCSSKFVLDCFGSLLLGLTCMLLFHQGLTSL